LAGTILAVGLIVFLAYFFAALFERTKLPDVLSLLLLGVLLGPVTGLVTPEAFGKMGGVMSTIALVVILFESGTSLETAVLVRALRPTMGLTLITFVATLFIVAMVGQYLLHLSWIMSFTLGAICGGTSSATVIPLVKILKLQEPVSTILVIESALTDVLCIVVSFALMEGAAQGGLDAGHMAGAIVASIVCAGLIGVSGGLAWLLVVNAVRQFPHTAFSTCAYACVLYGMAEWLGFSGGIAALAFGMTLTNAPNTALIRLPIFHQREVGALSTDDKSFFLEIIFLLKTFFFVFVGVSIKFSDLWLILFAALVVATVYLTRTVIVRFTVVPLDAGWEASAITSLLAPKGLAAAVLASLPLRRGLEGGEAMENFTYMVVLLSTLATATLIPAVPRSLGARICRRFFSKRPDVAVEESAGAG
jgi:cell volume regulation protein A